MMPLQMEYLGSSGRRLGVHNAAFRIGEIMSLKDGLG